ncbi:MAG: DegT/DnrJ/EryC1/StrS family aminotransferase [Planctomycetota bacterium]
MTDSQDALAIFGGPKAILDSSRHEAMFHWPIVTAEDEEAVLDVLRGGLMSGVEITKRFEREYADWIGARYALGHCNGTAAIQASMWACGVGAGDEIIAPSLTYWASAAQALQLGASVNFAEVDADTLCIDPDDIEHRIGPRTKLIVAVHYAGYPCDMDRIMAIARRHGLKVLEDTSHAQGTRYKGRMVGTIGDVGPMSLMAGKGFAIGEAGIVVTNDRQIYERCVSYGHYERTGVASLTADIDNQIHDEELGRFAGIPLGGAKNRMNQTCAAMGLVQLKYYPERMAEIDRAMTRFWRLLEGVPGVHPHRVPDGTGSTMGPWHYARGRYRAEELGGLPGEVFCEAVKAEGYEHSRLGTHVPMHTHPVFHSADIFGMGQPTMLSFGQRDVRQGPGSLPVTESIPHTVLSVPWFKHDDEAVIAQYASAYRKVALRAEELMEHARAGELAAAST